MYYNGAQLSETEFPSGYVKENLNAHIYTTLIYAGYFSWIYLNRAHRQVVYNGGQPHEMAMNCIRASSIDPQHRRAVMTPMKMTLFAGAAANSASLHSL